MREIERKRMLLSKTYQRVMIVKQTNFLYLSLVEIVYGLKCSINRVIPLGKGLKISTESC